jgi:hypothetical protein
MITKPTINSANNVCLHFASCLLTGRQQFNSVFLLSVRLGRYRMVGDLLVEKVSRSHVEKIDHFGHSHC